MLFAAAANAPRQPFPLRNVLHRRSPRRSAAFEEDGIERRHAIIEGKAAIASYRVRGVDVRLIGRNLLHELPRLHLQGFRDAVHVDDAEVDFAALDRADVGPVQAAHQSEAVLRQTLVPAESPHSVPEGLLNRVFLSAAHNPPPHSRHTHRKPPLPQTAVIAHRQLSPPPAIRPQSRARVYPASTIREAVY